MLLNVVLGPPNRQRPLGQEHEDAVFFPSSGRRLFASLGK